MFDKLEELVGRLEEINMMLTEPEVINDQKKYRELMREQNELTPIVEKYKEYKAAKDGIEDSLATRRVTRICVNSQKRNLMSARKLLRNVSRSLKFSCFQKTLTMRRMLLSKFVEVQAEMKQHFLRQTFSGCIQNLPRQTAGK